MVYGLRGVELAVMVGVTLEVGDGLAVAVIVLVGGAGVFVGWVGLGRGVIEAGGLEASSFIGMTVSVG